MADAPAEQPDGERSGMLPPLPGAAGGGGSGGEEDTMDEAAEDGARAMAKSRCARTARAPHRCRRRTHSRTACRTHPGFLCAAAAATRRTAARSRRCLRPRCSACTRCPAARRSPLAAPFRPLQSERTRLRRHRRTSVEDWQSGLKKATVLNQTKDKYVHMNAMAGRSLKDLHQAGQRSGETRDEVVHP